MIHSPCVEKNQCDEDVDGTLLGKPEAELKPADPDVIHLLNQQDAKAVGTHEPDNQAERDEAQIGAPVGHSIFRMHHVPAIVAVSDQFYEGVSHKKRRLLSKPPFDQR
jgi:hypothetical protein